MPARRVAAVFGLGLLELTVLVYPAVAVGGAAAVAAWVAAAAAP